MSASMPELPAQSLHVLGDLRVATNFKGGEGVPRRAPCSSLLARQGKTPSHGLGSHVYGKPDSPRSPAEWLAVVFRGDARTQNGAADDEASPRAVTGVDMGEESPLAL
jgi:hypothetical protein